MVALKEDEAVRLLPQRLQRGRDALRVFRVQQKDAVKRRELQRVLRHVVRAEHDARQRGVLLAGGEIGAVPRIEIVHLLPAVHACAAGRQRRAPPRPEPAAAARKEHEQRDRRQRIDAEDIPIHLIRRNDRNHQHICRAGQKRRRGQPRAAQKPLPRLFQRPEGQRRADADQRQQKAAELLRVERLPEDFEPAAHVAQPKRRRAFHRAPSAIPAEDVVQAPREQADRQRQRKEAPERKAPRRRKLPPRQPREEIRAA